jgi:DNA-binding HxlR family transcriptional regulator
VRRTRFDQASCPVARTSDLLGDWWTPLVLRELLLGRRRFADIQDDLGVSRAILSERLRRLEREGVVDRVRYEEHPPRFEYHLTDKGRALWEIVVAMWRFGDDWLFGRSDGESGALVELIDMRTGAPLRPRMIDETTGEPLDLVHTGVRPRAR